MSEKVLFEMRVSRDDDGTRIEINAAPEWRHTNRAAHRSRHHSHEHFFAGGGWCGAAPRQEASPPAADDLRRALDSLQQIYDDLYG